MEYFKFKNILITGGAGFIGSTLIRKLLNETNANIYNLDKLTYLSNLKSINDLINSSPNIKTSRYNFFKFDLLNPQQVEEAISLCEPDLIMHLAAESHVDRSINSPYQFIQSNIIGTFNLLEASKKYFKKLNPDKQRIFRFHHVSTDEVFGSLESEGKFNEDSNYDPQSPYSASKASSDHLVRAWNNTFGLPTIITNCSNNYGPWQFPDKLIPLIIMKALNEEKIPIYGDGKQIRDWLYVDDHVDALTLIASNGKIGSTYCIGGNNEKTNNDVAHMICKIIDKLKPKSFSHSSLIEYVSDRPGHDKRYSIDFSLLEKEMGWKPKKTFVNGISDTVDWYIKNFKFAKEIYDKNI